jgi:hypothetical protein
MEKTLEKFRYKSGQWASKEGDNYGLFFIKKKVGDKPLKVLCAPMGEQEWDHVSVSLPDRCPTWNEMCYIKELFWGDDTTVIQYHPPKKEYINNHPYCLHLWRNNKEEIKTPLSIHVGIK